MFEAQSNLIREIEAGEFQGLGFNINRGFQQAFSQNKTFSLFAGVNNFYDKGLLINLSGRLSHFKHYTETYIESGFLLSTISGRFDGKKYEDYWGYNIAIGQKYHSFDLGVFISYDHLFVNTSNQQEHYLRIGISTHKKTAIYTSIVALVGILVNIIRFPIFS